MSTAPRQNREIGDENGSNSSPKAKTTFFSLPCELRQKILLKTTPDRRTECACFYDGSRLWSERDLVRQVESHTSMLSDVHPRLEGDLQFVRKKWLSDVDKIFRKCSGSIEIDASTGTIKTRSGWQMLDPIACKLRADGVLQWL
ncbi:hypothetical protein FKW77_010662 [Venturia effusa]|uniref:Uncharacterized protein n=1 Tax=Venturia effusa TaxID=50376 RepID=A0A517KY37_9PEZI|nr:hypothetical protein FKW77_010662 [Venturia effusa]